MRPIHNALESFSRIAVHQTTMSRFTFTNTDREAPISLPTEFTITAPPSTDIWRKPPSTHSFTAPILHCTLPLSTFSKARVAVSAKWGTLYDQGGLILVLPQPDGTNKWVKTGIEFVHGQANVSTVAADRWADWSLLPLANEEGSSVTVEMAKEKDGSLWVYVIEGVKRKPIREVTWVFEEFKQEGEGERECWVGAYAAKPSKDGEGLEVNFGHLVIETTG